MEACEGSVIGPEALSLPDPARPADRLRDIVDTEGSLGEVSARAARLAEETMIREALASAGGNKSEAARKLKVSSKTLLHKVKELGLDKE